jgi:hypothetical protein
MGDRVHIGFGLLERRQILVQLSKVLLRPALRCLEPRALQFCGRDPVLCRADSREKRCLLVGDPIPGLVQLIIGLA